jgi:hypothetical protein
MPSFVLLRTAPGPIGLLFPCLVRVGSPGLFYLIPLPFRLFFLAFTKFFFGIISAALLFLGGDPCRSVGDQPPVLTPRGDPTRLGNLSVLDSFTPSGPLLCSASFSNIFL